MEDQRIGLIRAGMARAPALDGHIGGVPVVLSTPGVEALGVAQGLTDHHPLQSRPFLSVPAVPCTNEHPDDFIGLETAVVIVAV